MLNGDVLGSAIAAAVDQIDLTKDPPPTTEEMWKIIAGEIISHIVTNGEISVSVSTSHASGTINVAGTAVAQSNPLPIGSTSGSGTGKIK